MAVVTKEKVYSDKIEELRKRIQKEKPKLAVFRLHALEESYRETEGQPIILRRARLHEKYLKELPIYIDDNLIVGSLTEHFLGTPPRPDWESGWMRKGELFKVYYGWLEAKKEDLEYMHKVAEDWYKKSVWSRTVEVFHQKHPDLDVDDFNQGGVWLASAPQPYGTYIVEYPRVLHKGLKDVIQEIEEKLRGLPLGDLESLQKRHVYNAMLISCRAVIQFAHRYAALAREMAEREADPERKGELLGIAKTCQWVPENPARSFYEALQSFWLVHVCVASEVIPYASNLGRFAMRVYPFYRKDKDEGRLSKEEAIQLLQMLFIKHAELQTLFASKYQNVTQGHTAQQISLGGQDVNGDDATNELDFLCLEAGIRNKLPQPAFSILWHSKLSEEFRMKTVELVRAGLGQPAFQNYEASVQRQINHHGASLEDARQLAIVGCVHQYVPGLDGIWEGMLNCAKMVELALFNGWNPLTKKQIGPSTGEAEEFKSYDELHQAVRKQLQYFMPLMDELELTGENFQAELLPKPLSSALMPDCIERGKELYAGGARYEQNGIGAVGMINLGNSMAAIKKLVFEDKKITMKQLKEALLADFEGYEEIRHMLLGAPKYGNDDDYVDQIVVDWYRIFAEEHPKLNHLGRPTSHPYAFSPAAHFALGLTTGALPDTKKATIPLCDATVSAMPGTDKNGPTALARSAARAIDIYKYAHNHLNMKFHPQTLASPAAQRKLLDLIKTYMELGGHHVQFNCVSPDTLREAQSNPEEYKYLVVRVAGFSAFFVTLDKFVQDQIIERTELQL